MSFRFRQGAEHRYAYDAETLPLRLADAGFVDCRVRQFDPALDSRIGVSGRCTWRAARG